MKKISAVFVVSLGSLVSYFVKTKSKLFLARRAISPPHSLRAKLQYFVEQKGSQVKQTWIVKVIIVIIVVISDLPLPSR